MKTHHKELIIFWLVSLMIIYFNNRILETGLIMFLFAIIIRLHYRILTGGDLFGRREN